MTSSMTTDRIEFRYLEDLIAFRLGNPPEPELPTVDSWGEPLSAGKPVTQVVMISYKIS